MKTTIKVVAGLVLSALTLYLFLHNLDFGKVAASLKSASVPLVLASIVIGYFGHLSFRSRRWATMLEPLKAHVSFYNLFSTTAIGYAISWLTPGRVGEVVRPILLARRERIPVAGVLATAAIERVLDAVTILVLAAAAAVSAPLWWQSAGGSIMVQVPALGRMDLVRAITYFGAAGLVGSAIGLLVVRALIMEDSAFLRFVDRRSSDPGRLSKVWQVVKHLAEGASFLRSPSRALRVGLESMLIWVVIAFGSWVGLLAARVHIPFPGTFLLVALSAIGIAVPTPGGTGTVHFAFQRGLVDLFGIEPNLASAATVLYHPVTVYIPPVIFGLMFAWRDGLSPAKLRDLASKGEAERSAEEASRAADPAS